MTRSPWRAVGRCSMRSFVTALGRCWRRHYRPRSLPTSTRSPTRSTSTATGWWSATAPTRCGRSPPPRELSRCGRLGSTTNASTKPAALTQFLGSGAGLSAATITRLTAQWQGEAVAFHQRSLAGTDYVYVWVDGIHLKVRLEQDKVCLAP